jgi:hypothetical protein
MFGRHAADFRHHLKVPIARRAKPSAARQLAGLAQHFAGQKFCLVGDDFGFGSYN